MGVDTRPFSSLSSHDMDEPGPAPSGADVEEGALPNDESDAGRPETTPGIDGRSWFTKTPSFIRGGRFDERPSVFSGKTVADVAVEDEIIDRLKQQIDEQIRWNHISVSEVRRAKADVAASATLVQGAQALREFRAGSEVGMREKALADLGLQKASLEQKLARARLLADLQGETLAASLKHEQLEEKRAAFLALNPNQLPPTWQDHVATAQFATTRLQTQ